MAARDKPHGERIAALEVTVPALAAQVKASFDTMKVSFDELNATVKTLVEAEQQRIGAEKERKKQRFRRDAFMASGGGLIGGVVDFVIHLFHQ